MSITSIENIVRHVCKIGRMAFREQKKGMLDTGYKPDGSVITRIDGQVEDFLYAKISRAFPFANILTEETTRAFDPGKPYTFAIDPIDGTDAYSLGMPGWCVSVGLLKDFEPLAGIIYAPALDLLLFADVGQKASLNRKPLACHYVPAQISSKTNIVGSSSIHKQVDVSRYPGKIRNAGSAALHLCYPLIYPGIHATVESRHTHIWDILAAHAIVYSHGLAFERLSGGLFRYQELLDGSSVGDMILCGHKENIEQLRDLLSPRVEG